MEWGSCSITAYGTRPRSAGADPVLAFGAPPDRDTGWITTILQENGIAFVARDRERIVPLNERAAALPIFTQVH
jgi:hypothetical protein